MCRVYPRRVVRWPLSAGPDHAQADDGDILEPLRRGPCRVARAWGHASASGSAECSWRRLWLASWVLERKRRFAKNLADRVKRDSKSMEGDGQPARRGWVPKAGAPPTAETRQVGDQGYRYSMSTASQQARAAAVANRRSASQTEKRQEQRKQRMRAKGTPRSGSAASRACAHRRARGPGGRALAQEGTACFGPWVPGRGSRGAHTGAAVQVRKPRPSGRMRLRRRAASPAPLPRAVRRAALGLTIQHAGAGATAFCC